MDETLAMVAEFHRIFACAAPDEPRLDISDEDVEDLLDIAALMQLAQRACFRAAARREGTPQHVAFVRLQLIQEELAELAEGLAHRCIIETADALGDLQYVVDGAFLAFGLGRAKLPIVREVHGSNMTKLDEHGKPIINEAGRVVKGPDFKQPDLRRVLLEAYRF